MGEEGVNIYYVYEWMNRQINRWWEEEGRYMGRLIVQRWRERER